MNYFLQPQSYFQTPALIPTQIPPCNYAECFRYLIHKHPDVSPSDIFKSLMNFFFLSKANIEKVLKNTLTDCQSNAWSCWDFHYLLNFTDTPYPPYIKGSWKAADNRFVGPDLLSLVRSVRGGSDLDAIEFSAEVIGIDFTKTNVPQKDAWEGHNFVRHSHAYPNNPLLFSTAGNLLGPPKGTYYFYNENGHPSFLLLEWKAIGNPLRLFLTSQQNNHREGNVWEFIAPPFGYRFYNKHLIESCKDREIHIHDDIQNAGDSNTSQTIGTWAGDPSFAFKLDWSFLKGRVVKYLFDPKNQYSFRIGDYLLQAFRSMGTQLELCEYYK